MRDPTTLVSIAINVKIRLPTMTPERKVSCGAACARSSPTIKVGKEKLKSTLLSAIRHHAIDRSGGTGEVENSFDSIVNVHFCARNAATPRALTAEPCAPNRAVT